MGVKPSQSGARILAALEKIAAHQPIGVSDLTEDLSHLYRAPHLKTRCVVAAQKSRWNSIEWAGGRICRRP